MGMAFLIFISVFRTSGQAHAPLDQIHVNLGADLHAFLELMLVIALSTFGLDVLLDCVNLGLVLDELLLDVVEPVVDLVAKDLVLLGVMLHGMERYLLREALSVNCHELLDSRQALLLPLEVRLELIGLSELVVHVVFHVRALLLRVLHLVVDTSLQRLHLLKIVLDLLLLLDEPSSCRLGILHLILLELQIASHILDLRLRRQLVLSALSLLHVL